MDYLTDSYCGPYYSDRKFQRSVCGTTPTTTAHGKACKIHDCDIAKAKTPADLDEADYKFFRHSLDSPLNLFYSALVFGGNYLPRKMGGVLAPLLYPDDFDRPFSSASRAHQFRGGYTDAPKATSGASPAMDDIPPDQTCSAGIVYNPQPAPSGDLFRSPASGYGMDIATVSRAAADKRRSELQQALRRRWDKTQQNRTNTKKKAKPPTAFQQHQSTITNSRVNQLKTKIKKGNDKKKSKIHVTIG